MSIFQPTGRSIFAAATQPTKIAKENDRECPECGTLFIPEYRDQHRCAKCQPREYLGGLDIEVNDTGYKEAMEAVDRGELRVTIIETPRYRKNKLWRLHGGKYRLTQGPIQRELFAGKKGQ